MASLEDYRRPLDKVSTTQSATLAATGFIWTRYCLIIRPINYSLSVCNFMLGVANGFQCVRAYRHQKALVHSESRLSVGQSSAQSHIPYASRLPASRPREMADRKFPRDS
ncbi:Mitochondrial pyruvate carrier 2 [Eumeta japonica]|uniref:Mitochondrial pyruvate carrier n=1 Tax=Eumeta variegata TaxID=151549 RepID=A0A4C1U569_EUMVA|nr:Mitochondrial pyruvate carrier 2 [Eumeta japonica]